MMNEKEKCQLCGEPMPEGEEMFNYHGYSGKCPKPPLKNPPTEKQEEKCVRCGLPKSIWPKGRWSDPLCKIEGTEYDTHTLVYPPTEKQEAEGCGNACFQMDKRACDPECDCACHSKEAEDWKDKWHEFWNEESKHTEQRYLTPDTHGIIKDFISETRKEAFDRGYIQATAVEDHLIEKKIKEATAQERKRIREVVMGIYKANFSHFTRDYRPEDRFRDLVLSALTEPK